jgi:cytochrome c peroxidase
MSVTRKILASTTCTAIAVLTIGTAAAADPAPLPQLTGPALRQAAVNLNLTSLKAVKRPEPPNFATFVRDRAKLVQLGKALFWDEQVGSDRQACASCHFHAGADSRSKNQVNPGFRTTVPGGGDWGTSPYASPTVVPRLGPNHQLTHADFPLHKLANPDDRSSAVLSDTDDVVSSQGSFAAQFWHVGVPFDAGGNNATQGNSSVFLVPGQGGAQVRSVAPRNTPSAVNAIFNHRNFWDSRARSEYNGVDPIGKLDPTATVVEIVQVRGLSAGAFLHPVTIDEASAASQACGPPLSDVEMSYGGRRFPDLGRKLVSSHLQPLALQRVARNDSALGSLSRQRLRAGATGLMTTYADLIHAAFQPQWWDGGAWRVDLSKSTPALRRTSATGPSLFTVEEYNFSLFFGLAIAEYEKTLAADDSGFDKFMEGNNAALTPDQQAGMQIFLDFNKGGCVGCHGGPELTNAGLTNVRRRGKLVELDRLMESESPRGDLLERMIMADGGVAVYDTGHYNIGVRPSAEDLGIGARIGPKNLPLSNARRFQECMSAQPVNATTDPWTACEVPRILARPGEAAILLARAVTGLGGNPAIQALIDQANALLGPNDPLIFFEANPMGASFLLNQARDQLLPLVAGDPALQKLVSGATMMLPDPFSPGADPLNPLAPPLQPDERTAADGSFKVPGLRNVALTAPYFHNGGQATLRQVVDFYDRGGDFGPQNADFDPIVRPLNLTEQEKDQLVAFLEALTDERTRWEKAPFDHPSLSLANGGTPGVYTMAWFPGYRVLDDRVELPEVGATGSAVPLGTPHTPFANFLDPLQ